MSLIDILFADDEHEESILSKRRIYFAHPINTYNTILETFFLDYMKKYPDVFIVNPNSAEHEKQYKLKGMSYFKTLVRSCDKLIAFGFGDNSIGAGIAKEMDWMREKGGTVIFMPFFREWDEMVVPCAKQFNVLSVEETREKLKQF
jgi:hypothetical protein